MLILYIIFATKHLFININQNDPQENTNYESFFDMVLKAKNRNGITKKLVEKKRNQPINSQTRGLADCMVKEMSLLTGRLLTDYLFNVLEHQNFASLTLKLLHRRLATISRYILMLTIFATSAKVKKTLLSTFFGAVQWFLASSIILSGYFALKLLYIRLSQRPIHLLAKTSTFLCLVARLFIGIRRIQNTHLPLDLFLSRFCFFLFCLLLFFFFFFCFFFKEPRMGDGSWCGYVWNNI